MSLPGVRHARHVVPCARCGSMIRRGAAILRAVDLGAWVHVACVRPMAGQDYAVGFTGTRDLPPAARIPLARWLDGLGVPMYVTGGARGVDAFVGQHLRKSRALHRHVVIVPADQSQVVPWWLGRTLVEVVEMPEGTTYKDRNETIVAASDHLVACVAHPEDHPASKRSGTWQTVRMAREADIGVTLLDLGQPHTIKSTPYPVSSPRTRWMR